MILVGDVEEQLGTLDPESVQCVVTSPPYWGLRDYGVEGQLGLEKTPEEYIDKMVQVFSGVRRVLRDDGTLWLNIGDSYASDYKGSGGPSAKQDSNAGSRYSPRKMSHGIKPKDLCLIPERLAIALQDDGWWIRSRIAWCKKSSMPESVTDRPTSAWEHIWLLTKSARYYYDAEAVKTSIKEDSNGQVFGGANKHAGYGSATYSGNVYVAPTSANLRNYWLLGPEPYPDAHFATFPSEIPRRCIKAGTKPQDTVLDPFLGSGTTAAVAQELDRKWVGIELNPEYAALAQKRIDKAGFSQIEIGI
jgi:DNA modification methylase